MRVTGRERSARPGQAVTLTIAHGDQALTTEVRLGELPGS